MLSRPPGIYLTISHLSRKGADSLVDTIGGGGGGGRLLSRSKKERKLTRKCCFFKESFLKITIKTLKLVNYNYFDELLIMVLSGVTSSRDSSSSRDLLPWHESDDT